MPARKPIAGHQQLTVSTAALSLTVPKGASLAVISCGATNGIRFRDDGTDPTAAIGIAIQPLTNYEYYGSLRAVKLIRSGAADATVDIAYYDHGGSF